jgi:hypothetical protein
METVERTNLPASTTTTDSFPTPCRRRPAGTPPAGGIAAVRQGLWQGWRFRNPISLGGERPMSHSISGNPERRQPERYVLSHMQTEKCWCRHSVKTAQ